MNKVDQLTQIQNRIQQLGFYCPSVPLTHLISAPVYALICMPMYYVASAIVIKTDEEVPESLIEDLFGVKNVRESFTAGNEVSELPVSEQDSRHLQKFLIHRRPIDSIIYDFALDTIGLFFEVADESVVQTAKMIVAKTVVAVAHASGEGWFGSGAKASPEQNDVIRKICHRLTLSDCKAATAILSELQEDVLLFNPMNTNSHGAI